MGAAKDRSVDAVLLPLADVRLDGGTQSRAELNADAIAEYAEKYADGLAMPPVVVFYDGKSYWLADGFHRCNGAKQAGKEAIVAEVHQGSQRDAILYSVGANARHGLRRTNADKRRAVEMLLRDAEWGSWSDQVVAVTCVVSRSFVQKLRPEQPATMAGSARTGLDGKVRKMPEREAPTPQVAPAAPEQTEPQNEAPTEEDERDTDAEAQLFEADWEDFERGDAAPEVEPPTSAPVATAAPVSRSVIDALEALAAQRNADPDFASLRETQRAVGKAMPSRAQAMLNFTLDGGELALLRLGLDWNVTADSLRQAFRDKSRAAHPDRGGSQAEFVKLNQAKDLVHALILETT
jgi:hypothetical protein